MVPQGSTVSNTDTLSEGRELNKNIKWQHNIDQTTRPLTNQALNIQNCRGDNAPMEQKSCFLQHIKNFTFFANKTY